MQTQDQTILKEHLVSLGAEESELDGIIGDVAKVITERILTEYFDEITPEAKTSISTLSGPELAEHISKNKKLFPPLSQEKCKAIAEETWADYFRFMEEKT